MDHLYWVLGYYLQVWKNSDFFQTFCVFLQLKIFLTENYKKWGNQIFDIVVEADWQSVRTCLENKSLYFIQKCQLWGLFPWL